MDRGADQSCPTYMTYCQSHCLGEHVRYELLDPSGDGFVIDWNGRKMAYAEDDSVHSNVFV